MTRSPRLTWRTRLDVKTPSNRLPARACETLDQISVVLLGLSLGLQSTDLSINGLCACVKRVSQGFVGCIVSCSNCDGCSYCCQNRDNSEHDPQSLLTFVKTAELCTCLVNTILSRVKDRLDLLSWSYIPRFVICSHGVVLNLVLSSLFCRRQFLSSAWASSFSRSTFRYSRASRALMTLSS